MSHHKSKIKKAAQGAEAGPEELEEG